MRNVFFLKTRLTDYRRYERISKNYGYVRVSTKEQNEARQMIALENIDIELAEIFIDKQSGKDFYNRYCASDSVLCCADRERGYTPEAGRRNSRCQRERCKVWKKKKRSDRKILFRSAEVHVRGIFFKKSSRLCRNAPFHLQAKIYRRKKKNLD